MSSIEGLSARVQEEINKLPHEALAALPPMLPAGSGESALDNARSQADAAGRHLARAGLSLREGAEQLTTYLTDIHGQSATVVAEMRTLRQSLHPESFEYGIGAVTIAATSLQRDINALAAGADPAIAVEIKTDPLGVNSPVTQHDQATERLIGDLYKDTKVRIKGEEKINSWPEDEMPELDLHVDPIDGTELFIEYVNALIAWEQLPEDARPPRPICGSMVSAGALRPGSNEPEWGAIAAPFMLPDGIVRWTVSADEPAVRIEPDGSRHELPQADTLPIPETGGIVLVASDSAERVFGDALRAAGYRVVKYKSAVAAALCAMDPGLFKRLCPDEAGDEPVVGVVMRSAKNWDVAAVVGIANKLGHFVSNTQGGPRTFEDGTNSAIFATGETTGRALVEAVAPHVGK